MKKIKFILLFLFVGILFAGCGSSSNNFQNLSYSEFQNKLKNKETFFFVVIRDGCSFCESFVPKVEEVLNEYDVIGYKLNISTFTEEEYNEFDATWNVDGTPTTIFISDGTEVSIMQRIDGATSKEKVKTKLIQNGYIKEK